VRSIVRSEITNYQAEAIYGTQRSLLETEINDEIAARFAQEGLILNSFLIRELNFTDEFSQAIEQKEIESQQLQRARTEAQRRETEALGQANAVIEQARGEAEAIRVRAAAQADALRLISEQIAANPMLIQYEYIQKLADNINMALIPSNSPFLFDFDSLSSLPEANANFVAPQVPTNTGSTEGTADDTP
jgi:regulator of protease activity HflC (stomatin/prohibitin superfamily)